MSIISPSNLYYLLAYSLRIRPDDGVSKGMERFDNHLNVLTMILSRSMDSVIRRGLVRYYTPHSETTVFPHGRIDIGRSVRTASIARNMLSCHYEEYDHRTYANRVIHSMMERLLLSELDENVREALRRTYNRMDDPGPLEQHEIDWSRVSYRGHDRAYITALNVCRLISKGMIPRDSEGSSTVGAFMNEERECALYEEFLRGFFQVEYPSIFDSRRELRWDTGSGDQSGLPRMEMDLLLRSRRMTVIADAKCYTHALASHMGATTYHSANIYQIKAYVGNWKHSNPADDTEGILLYAYNGTDRFDDLKSLDGDVIRFMTLDLNGEWSEIRQQLDFVAGLLVQ